MAKTSRSSGAVVLRGKGKDCEVLVVHRPRYDDWSLPKGHVDEAEPDAVTAVRETLEETGYKIRLVAPLSAIRYQVKKRSKVVTWWLGELANETPLEEHDDETDKIEWWPIGQAIRKLTYDDDVKVLVEGVRAPKQIPFLIVRHAKALGRKNWDGKDIKRPLTKRGDRQSAELAKLLQAFGIATLASSSAERCIATLRPYAEKQGIKIDAYDDLTEPSFEKDPRAAEWAMSQIRGRALDSKLPTAVCGHRPVLPTMIEYVGLEVDHTLEPAEVLSLSLDKQGQALEPLHMPPEI